ncbi:glycoxylase [Legionella busanensis]|uniref:Glycoxylase n=1 Tax=Legionella busanensis TaxID=190655 RepID=A0A378JQ27_9GAMM|nr:VOC family protein [Legionella busanensis]STX52821.1 glycoxylase [Legionella busanensis]
MSISNSNPFCWHELITPHLDQAKDFYTKLLGWQFIEHTINNSIYTMIIINDKEFGGIKQMTLDSASDSRAQWLSYLSVNNLNSILDQAKKLGAIIKTPMTAIGNYGHFAVITDPTGATVALWEPQSKCAMETQ